MSMVGLPLGRVTAITALTLSLGACGGHGGRVQANQVAQDPFGATGAPGSDLTDNGVTDGSSGLADNGQADQPLGNDSGRH